MTGYVENCFECPTCQTPGPNERASILPPYARDQALSGVPAEGCILQGGCTGFLKALRGDCLIVIVAFGKRQSTYHIPSARVHVHFLCILSTLRMVAHQ